MIESGKLDRRIRIEQATATQDATSREPIRTWPPDGGVLLAEVWAERLPQTGREMYQERQAVAEVSVGWRIRWQTALSALTPDESFRIVDDTGRAFDIAEVREEGRREGLLIFGKGRAE